MAKESWPYERLFYVLPIEKKFKKMTFDESTHLEFKFHSDYLEIPDIEA